jgi:hypothetical protein
VGEFLHILPRPVMATHEFSKLILKPNFAEIRSGISQSILNVPVNDRRKHLITEVTDDSSPAGWESKPGI